MPMLSNCGQGRHAREKVGGALRAREARERDFFFKRAREARERDFFWGPFFDEF